MPDSPHTADIVERLLDLDSCTLQEDAAEAAAEIKALRELVLESLYHLRMDSRAEAYHERARAALKDHRKVQS